MSVGSPGRAGEARGGPQHIPRPAGVRLGAPAPWSDVDRARRRLALDDVRDALAASGPAGTTAAPDAEPGSAVLAPLYEADGETWIVLTRRAWTLRSHTGEVSFPGGRREGDETLWETALRESHEEVGLDPGLVTRVGELDRLSTITKANSIVPFVGALDTGRPDLVAQPSEVDAILHVPLSELLDPDIFREEIWDVGADEMPLYFFELVGDTVWGATGSMLVDLLSRVTGTRDRVDRLR